VLAASLVVSAGAPARAAARVDRAADASRVFGEISYVVTAACPGEEKELFVDGATIVLKRGGQRAESPLAGHFDVRLGGSGPITAYVELKSPFATIKAFGASHPYRIPVNLHAGKNEVLIRHKGQDAAANVATVIDEGARFAKHTLPAGATLPPVTVLLRYTTDFSHDEKSVGQTAYFPARRTIEIDNDPKHPDYRYEWERFAILHEYGHHVLDSLADPGPRSGGEHTFTGVYPDRPALAWSEGFADAFAALVTGPELKLQCRLIADLVSTPARPSSEDPVEIDQAQYNEIQAAGVVWHVVNLRDLRGGINSNDRTRKLLAAVRAFKDRPGAGHYPQSMREVRDALVGSPLEPDTVAGHDAIDKIFSDDHMGWGVAVLIEDNLIESTDPSSFGQYLHLRLIGPYGTCEDPRPNQGPPRPVTGRPGATFDGGVVEGGVPATWKDDCFIASGPANDPNPGGLENHGHLDLWFPYLPDQRHATGEFKLYATFHCDPFLAQPRCGGSFTYHLYLYRGWFLNEDKVVPPGDVFRTAFSATANREGHHLFEDLPLKIDDGKDTEILSFDAQGKCEIVPLHEDCSV
jgi:hypothetical protein